MILPHAVPQINDHVDMLLHKPKTKDLPFIFLVGGFAESSRLQKSLRDTFGERVTILVSVSTPHTHSRYTVYN